jgi:streptogramin lyase
MRRLRSCLNTIIVTLAFAAVATAQVTITGYPVPTAGSYPSGITAGPDGNLWFTEQNINQVGQITTAGVITPFAAVASPSIVTGPDGNLWFTDYFGQAIWNMTTNGNLTRFSLPNGASYPWFITTGPDGNLWFTARFGSYIGRITTTGTVTEFPIATSGSEPYGITTGSDGNLWFTECRCSAGASGPINIGRVTPTGVVTEFPIALGSAPQGITNGPDGNVWFTESGANKIGRITPSGEITEFAIPETGSPYGITTGPDGNLWFTPSPGFGYNLGRITTAGIVTVFSLPAMSNLIQGIVTGPDGNLWLADPGANQIVKAALCTPPTIATVSAAPNLLWPPNHKLVPVTVSVTASGGCSSVTCRITSVRSNEPLDSDGDWAITGNLTLELRAERLGSGTGRIYTITVQCVDSLGNSTTKTVNVSVPHDQGN